MERHEIVSVVEQQMLRAARGKVFDHSPEVRRYMGIEQY